MFVKNNNKHPLIKCSTQKLLDFNQMRTKAVYSDSHSSRGILILAPNIAESEMNGNYWHHWQSQLLAPDHPLKQLRL